MRRDEFEALLRSSDDELWPSVVKEFLQNNSRLRDYHYLYRKIFSEKSEPPSAVRVAILSSFTLDQIKEPLAAELLKYGFFANIYVGGYNQVETEILNEHSALHRFQPDVLILALRIEDLLPDVMQNFLGVSSEYLRQKADDVIQNIKRLVFALYKDKKIHILINNFLYPSFSKSARYDFQKSGGRLEWIDGLNAQLRQLVQGCSNAHLFNLFFHVFEYGRERAQDHKMWHLAKIPFTADFIIHLAKIYSEYVKAILGKPKKCLVLDLDNTLWGGTAGEDGIAGIQIGHTFPGNVFREIQTIIRQHASEGVILALNSKNDLQDVKAIFDSHPDMVLKWQDFASTQVNWRSKAENLGRIAQELTIGTDSLVFVDDSRFEIESVKRLCPEVATIQLSDDVLDNLRVFKAMDAFLTLDLSASDLSRGRQYQDQARRRHLEASSVSLEDFLRSLAMVAEIRECDSFSAGRVAQLTQKTNQFNLTTKRYSQDEIENFMTAQSSKVYYLRLRDRFGDNGIVGAVIIKETDRGWHLDTFLLSCRVIGRTVEAAFLAFVQAEAQRRGIGSLIGEYVPTGKNELVKDVYADQGFMYDSGYWVLDTSHPIKMPDWITIDGPEECPSSIEDGYSEKESAQVF